MKNHTTPSKSTVVNGRTYHVYLLPGRRNLNLLARLMRAASPALAALSEGPADIGKKDVSVLAAAVRATLSELGEADFAHVQAELLWDWDFDNDEGERCPGTPVNLDGQFAGDALGLLTLLWFAVEANYGNFFARLQIAAAKPTPASAAAKV